MGIKKIGITAGILTGSFLVILVIMYMLYPVLNPEEAEKVESNIQKEQVENRILKNTEAEYTENIQKAGIASDTRSSETGDSLSVHRTDTNLQDELSKMEKSYSVKIDSLQKVIENLKNEHELELKEVRNVQSEEQVQETTKTLLNMDEDVLAPIVNQLEEPILIKLYKTASGMQKQKLLQALEPEKASRILKLVM